MKLRDIRMIQKAMEQRWNIKPEYKDALVRRLTAIIADPNSTKREVTSASRALIAAEAQNQADEFADDKAEQDRNRFLDIAARLGIGGSAGHIADDRTQQHPFAASIDDDRLSPEGRANQSTRTNGEQASGDPGSFDSETA